MEKGIVRLTSQLKTRLRKDSNSSDAAEMVVTIKTIEISVSVV
jgi:hypothetical protein